jgi:glycosyltransferase involved in cell wall biosynthesis
VSEIREIEWRGTYDISGYGNWSKYNSIALLHHPEKYRIKPDIFGYKLSKDDPLYKNQEIFLVDPIRVYNLIPLDPPIGKKAGFCTCTEIKVPPLNQLRNMLKAKFVLALSEFSVTNFKNALREKGGDPNKVHKVNYPIFGGFSPKGKRLKYKNLEKYKFKFLFVGRIDVRKNIESLIQAFKDEFGNSINVCLLLKIYSPDYNIPIWLEKQQPTKNIFWLRENIPDISMLYRSCDSYACTDFGEAWGGPCTEAMLCGLPTIAPRHSGHLDYMNDENSYLIDVGEWEEIGSKKKNLYEHLLPPEALVKYPIYENVKKKLREVYEEFRGLSLEDRLNHPKIKKALEVEKLVCEETIYDQLDKAFDWIVDNV